MLELERLYLENLHVWRSVSFNFEPGITFVTGSNGSGKTLLFRSLASIIRPQVVKRGSSLSRLPKRSAIGLDFKNIEEWSARLTDSRLTLNKGGTDQGSTGKAASREALNAALAIPAELFDSTIHIQGAGEHPLIALKSTPASRLEWFSAVLALTEVYDAAAIEIKADYDVAASAAIRLAALEDEYCAIEQHTAPNLPELEAAVAKWRRLAEKFRSVSGELQTLARWGSLDEAALRFEQSTVVAAVEDLRYELQAAETYEREAARAATVSRLTRELGVLHEMVPPQYLPQLRLLADNLSDTAADWHALQSNWNSSLTQRETLASYEAQLATMPGDLEWLLTTARVQLAASCEQLEALKRTRGSRCPVCLTNLSQERRSELALEARNAAAAAKAQLIDLQVLERVARDAERLRSQLTNVIEPPFFDLTEACAILKDAVQQGEQATALRERLEDLEAHQLSTTSPQRSVTEIKTALTEAEATRSCLERNLVAAEQSGAARNVLQQLFGEHTPQQITAQAVKVEAQLEASLAALATGRAAQAACDEATRRTARLDAAIAEAREAALHLPELTELREAVGKRGLRLSRIRDAIDGFVAEFNSLVPVLWPNQFVLEMLVNEGGVEIFATRKGNRDDLDALSGAENKVWKMILALTWLRLLPERLRCDTIILDEIEANMDDDIKERFVSHYLEELRKNVSKVIIVSPNNYESVSLARTASYRVENDGTFSSLVRTG